MDARVLETSLTILIGAILLDFLFGEPRPYIHPSALIRKIGAVFDPYFRVFRHKAFFGFLYDVFILLLILGTTFIILYFLRLFYIAYIIAAIVVFKGTFSLSRIRDEVNPIVEAIETENIDEARLLAGRFVHRDLTKLDANLISSAVIERIFDDLVNFVVAPFFYFSFLGILGALGSRVIHVLDSSVGQRNRRNFEFGRSTAILHTLINYVPSRIAGILIIAGSSLLDYRVLGGPFKSMRLAADTATVGWPVGAFASSLNLRMERPGTYLMNEGGFLPSAKEIRKAVRQFYLAFYLMIILITIPIMIGLYYIP